MSKEEIIKKFEQIKENSDYIRVSDKHPIELYLGRDSQGLLTLRYNGKFKKKQLIGSSMLEIKQTMLPNFNSLMFVFLAKSNESLFYSFCEDIINNTIDCKEEEAYSTITDRYAQWKKMFYASSNTLSEIQVMGLIGELLFLKEYSLMKKDPTYGLNGWSGPEPTHKDFSYGDEWFEIKTINSSKNSVHISSIEQLDGKNEGRLVIYQLEKMSVSFDGININKLVNDIFVSLQYDLDRDLFVEKLKQAGYSYNEIYDNYIFNFVRKDTYIVNETFPRIKADDLPNGIIKLNYELQLSSIEKYKEV